MDPWLKIAFMLAAIAAMMSAILSGVPMMLIRAFRGWRYTRRYKSMFLLEETAREYGETIRDPHWRQKSQLQRNQLAEELRNSENWRILPAKILSSQDEYHTHQGIRNNILRRRVLVQHLGRFFVCQVQYEQTGYYDERRDREYRATKILWMTDLVSQFSKSELELISGLFRTGAKKARERMEISLVSAVIPVGLVLFLLIPSVIAWLGIMTFPANFFNNTRFVGGPMLRDVLAVLGLIILALLVTVGWFHLKARRLDTRCRYYAW